MKISIRDATLEDAPLVTDFNARLAYESEGKTLDLALLTPGVDAMLADRNKGRYFLACQDDKVVGQLAITYEWSDWRNGWFWWFQSVYVRKEARRAGIFSVLYDHVLQMAKRQDDVCGLRLYVENANHNAQATYAARGMVPAGYQVMELDLSNRNKGAQS